MKVGIIVCSYTGNTLTVSEKLAAALKEKGVDAVIDTLKPQSEKPGAPAQIAYAPDAKKYDAFVFASPVQGFQLAPLMRLYLSSLPNIAGKKVCCFLTQHLKRAFFGGNRALKQIKSAVNARGATVQYAGIVHWSSPERENQTRALVSSITAALIN